MRVLLLQTEFGSHTSVEGERVVRCEEEKSIPSSTAGVRKALLGISRCVRCGFVKNAFDS